MKESTKTCDYCDKTLRYDFEIEVGHCESCQIEMKEKEGKLYELWCKLADIKKKQSETK